MLVELELLVKDLWFELQFDVDGYGLNVLALEAGDCHAEALIVEVVQGQRALVIHEANRNFLLQDSHRQSEQFNVPRVRLVLVGLVLL